jgi:transcriptional regulator with PAS, ATPase and Fis domain
VSFNCAAFSEALLESELFGHERGAFTGAVHEKTGLLESAPGGTIFLDEIGEMPLALQAKLLRVLEEKKVTRVGALAARPIDVRFVAATNRDLEAEVDHGAFRRDLYYRLSAFTIAIPPLRERVGEIAPLARGFVEEAAVRAHRRVPELSAEAIATLEAMPWPGNVRELRNTIDRALVLATGDLIEACHLGEELAPAKLAPEPADERERIRRALEQCAGNQTKAARVLGIARGTLIARMEQYGLPRPKKAPPSQP